MIKISHDKISKIFLIVIIILMIVILGSSTNFIYKYVYKTIILAPSLESLKIQASFSSIRIDLFEKIDEKIDKKTSDKNNSDLTGTVNPF